MSSKKAMKLAQKQAFAKHRSNITNTRFGSNKIDFLNKSLMTRNYIYDSKTFKKLKLTDLSIKKENTIEKFIYEDDNLFFTDKVGYPQFYTQLVFEKNNPKINIKTVINNEEALAQVSTCNKVEVFKEES